MATPDRSTLQTPAELGFAMPAEWERHEATWLAWPHNPTDWPDKLDTIRWVYGEIVRKISPGEIVRILVRSQAEENLARSYLTRSGADLDNVRFIRHPTNRGWMRDSGPIFVRKRQDVRGPSAEVRGSSAAGTKRRPSPLGSETAIVHFHFNAWAKYEDWQKDRAVPDMAARLLGKRLFHAQCQGRDLVLEGGGIEVNGQGALLTTEECYLDPKVQVRNPGLGRSELDQALEQYLGVTTGYPFKHWQGLAQFEIGRCFLSLGKRQQAIDAFRTVVEKYPDHPRAQDAGKMLAELK